MLDFLSLGGSLGFTEEVQQMLIAAGLENDFYHLKIPYNPKCNFANYYEVKAAPQMVAISVKDKDVHTKDPQELMQFINKLKEGGICDEYLLARKKSAEQK